MEVCEEHRAQVRDHSEAKPQLITLPCCIKNIPNSTLWLSKANYGLKQYIDHFSDLLVFRTLLGWEKSSSTEVTKHWGIYWYIVNTEAVYFQITFLLQFMIIDCIEMTKQIIWVLIRYEWSNLIQCWEGNFGNVIGYWLQVTLFKNLISSVTISNTLLK